VPCRDHTSKALRYGTRSQCLIYCTCLSAVNNVVSCHIVVVSQLAVVTHCDCVTELLYAPFSDAFDMLNQK